MTPLLTSQGDAGKLDELIERAEKLTGPDREIDAAIMEALGFQVARAPLRRNARGWAYLDAGRWNRIPDLTASIDAALALVERVLPGAMWQLHRHGMTRPHAGKPHCSLNPNRDGEVVVEVFGADAETFPLAIILATLRALKTLSGDSHG